MDSIHTCEPRLCGTGREEWTRARARGTGGRGGAVERWSAAALGDAQTGHLLPLAQLLQYSSHVLALTG